MTHAPRQAGPEIPAAGRLKVLRVITRLNIGGPARHAIILHRGLAEAGWNTRLVYGNTGPGEGSFEGLLDKDCPPAVKLEPLGPQPAPLHDIRAFARLLRIVFAERPDVIHTHTAKAGTLGRLAAFVYNATRPRASRSLVVHTFHGNVLQGYFSPAASRVIRAAERILAAATDRVVTISPRQRLEITDLFRIAPGSKVDVIPLGLDLCGFFGIGDVNPELRGSLGFPPSCVLFAAVGRLVPIKDFPTLLRAFALARGRSGSADLRLVIAGDGQEGEALQALAGSLGIDDAVRFLGWREDLVGLYRGVDGVALSSLNEGTPVALIEAMAAGRPVVATAVGGVPDVVSDGVNGLLVPPESPEPLAGALLRLAASAEERRRLGAAGRAAARGYHHSHLLEALSELYLRGLGTKRRVDARQ